MRTARITGIITAVFFSGLIHNALAEDERTAPSPVEAFYCNYQEGKDMDDLKKIAERFSDWAEEGHSDYSAWLLTPQFGQLGELPDVLWLGSNSTGDMMGKGLDAYMAEGVGIQREFDKVVDCYAHVLASSTEIHAPDGPPQNGVVMFTQCSMDDDADWREAAEAHGEFSSAMREMGAKNSSWMFFPMLGAPADLDLDYWSVTTFSNWSEYFAAYEMYVNGGGWQAQMDALDDAASCATGTASVWTASLVRQRAD